VYVSPLDFDFYLFLFVVRIGSIFNFGFEVVPTNSTSKENSLPSQFLFKNNNFKGTFVFENTNFEASKSTLIFSPFSAAVIIQP